MSVKELVVTFTAILSLLISVAALIIWLRGGKIIFLPGLHLAIVTPAVVLLFLIIACLLFWLR